MTFRDFTLRVLCLLSIALIAGGAASAMAQEQSGGEAVDQVEYGAVIFDTGTRFFGLVTRDGDTVEVKHRSGTIYALPASRIIAYKTQKMSRAAYEEEVHTWKNSYLEYKIRRPDDNWVISDRPVSPLNDTQIYHKKYALQVGVYISPDEHPDQPLSEAMLKPVGDQILIDMLEFYQSASLDAAEFITFKDQPCLKYICSLTGWEENDKSRGILYIVEHGGLTYRLQADYDVNEGLERAKMLYQIIDTFEFIQPEKPGADVYLDEIYHFRVNNIFDWQQKLDLRDDRHIVKFNREDGSASLTVTAYYTDVKPDVEAMTENFYTDMEAAGATVMEPTRGMLNYGTVGYSRAVKTGEEGSEVAHFVSHFWTNQVCYRIERVCANTKEALQESELLNRELTVIQDLKSDEVVVERMRAVDYYITGHKLFVEENDIDGAKAAFLHALEIYPSYAGALAYMAMCELDRNTSVALSYLDKTTDLLADLPSIRDFNRSMYMRVAIIESGEGNYRKAIQRLEQGRRFFDGQHETVWKQSMAMLNINQGRVEANKGDWRDAIECFEDALKHEPANKNAAGDRDTCYNNWATELANKNRDKEAVKIAERGLKANPNNGALSGLIARLKK